MKRGWLFGMSLACLLAVGCGPGGIDTAELGTSDDGLTAGGATQLLPTRDVDEANVVGVPDNRDLFKDVNDSAWANNSDDAQTYVRSTDGDEWAHHTVGYANGPAGRLTRVAIRYRAAKGTAEGTVQVKLFDGDTQVASGDVHPLGAWQSYVETFDGLHVSSVANLRTRIILHNTRGAGSVRYSQVAVGVTAGSNPPPQDANKVPVPKAGAYLGSSTARLSEIEPEIGRKYSIVHTYHAWDSEIPNDQEKAWADGGRILFIDWDAGRTVTWAEIAAGRQDAQIDQVAANLKAFGKPVFLNFNHEPEADAPSPNGPPSDFVLAWRHIHDRFVRDNVTNVSFAWIVMGFNLDSFPQFYPGDAYVDWLGNDPYNWFGCHPESHPQIWRPFKQIVAKFYGWATTNHPGKPLMLGEYGTNENAPGMHPTKGEWFTQSVQDLKTTYPALKALVYFNQGHQNGFCDRWVDTSASSLAGYKQMAHDPYFTPSF